MLGGRSNSQMQSLARRMEHLLTINGIPLHSKRRNEERLHVTIASIAGHLALHRNYPRLLQALRDEAGNPKNWPKFRPNKLSHKLVGPDQDFAKELDVGKQGDGMKVLDMAKHEARTAKHAASWN